MEEILRGRLRRRQVDYTARVASRRWPGCTSSSGSAAGRSRCPTSTRTTSSAGWSRPPAPGTRTSPRRACATSAARRRAARLDRAVRARPSPRPTRRTSAARVGVADLRHARGRSSDERRACRREPLPAEPGRPADERRFKLYRVGPLSPHRRPADLHRPGRRGRRRAALTRCTAPTAPTVLHLRLRAAVPDAAIWTGRARRRLRELFEDAFAAVWDGRAESDGFNALVLARRAHLAPGRRPARLRQVPAPDRVDVQPGLPRATRSSANAASPAALVDLFEARFDPDRFGTEGDAERARPPGRAGRSPTGCRRPRRRGAASTTTGSCAPSWASSRPTLRTNFYQPDDDGGAASRTSRSSSTPRRCPTCRRPGRCSRSGSTRPRVEGVHLRFGKVARGGLRWTDRREDFRTEVLGLVKAQTVKNAVIVPTGAKGGFYAKQLPDPAVDREAWLAEGIACYKTVHLAACSTSPTTCVAGARRCRPQRRGAPRRRRHLPRGRRRQGHGDLLRHRQRRRRRRTASGSATRSPPAARPATTTRPWASPPAAPGSRSSGTSARWASTPRREDFTVVGVGDMSGDVFGNGMLLSEHIRLVAAFDHRHIFLDPTPDAAASFAERRRLFDLPALVVGRLRHVADLDGRRRLPAHGRSRSRSRRRWPHALGLPAAVTAMTPAELMHAILLAPGRPALERRHRHLRQGLDRDQRRGRRQGQRRDPGRRQRSCGSRWSARAATSA